MIETDVDLPDGRILHVYDTGPTSARTTVVWHHGTPNLGTPPAPLAEVSTNLGVRWLSFDRPGYGSSTPVPDRDVASVAGLVALVADVAGVERFAVMGHSGGGPHALACSALLPHRTSGVVTLASPAPAGADGLDRFAGMHPSAAAALHAAARGRAAKEQFEAGAEFDPAVFTAEDHAALAGPWSWFDEVVGPALADGPGGLIDDDLAYVRPWGFDLTPGPVPILVVHGGQDRMVPAAHGAWLADRTRAEHRLDAEDGHISVLRHAAAALEWLVELGESTTRSDTESRRGPFLTS